MSHAFDEANGRSRLRQRASEQLMVGHTAASRRPSESEALAVLHQLASSPSTAGDAMALLHELQVHQVELDLQQDELRRSQSELEAALMRQATLVERAPVGYMTVDASTVLYEINLAGVRLLGGEREALLGRRLAVFLPAHSASALQGLLARAHDGLVPESCELQLMSPAGEFRTVHATAGRDTASGRFLLVLMNAAVASQ
jgi:PAS domain S-box-containing protein